MYAGGNKMFGDKIYKEFDAPPGNYNVYIKLDNGEEFSDKIYVRDDPLRSN